MLTLILLEIPVVLLTLQLLPLALLLALLQLAVVLSSVFERVRPNGDDDDAVDAIEVGLFGWSER